MANLDLLRPPNVDYGPCVPCLRISEVLWLMKRRDCQKRQYKIWACLTLTAYRKDAYAFSRGQLDLLSFRTLSAIVLEATLVLRVLFSED
jgi:hypothetical protein